MCTHIYIYIYNNKYKYTYIYIYIYIYIHACICIIVQPRVSLFRVSPRSGASEKATALITASRCGRSVWALAPPHVLPIV